MPEPPFVLRDFQLRILEEAQEKLRRVNSLLITAPTGAGKCHPKGTMLMMHDGTAKPVEELKPGDRLMGPDSLPRNILSTSTGYGPIVQINPLHGEPWQCNEDHILTLVRTEEPNNPAERKRNRGGELVDISVREYMQKSKSWKHLHKLVRAQQIHFKPQMAMPNQAEEASPLGILPPYILGLLLGDGDLTNRRTQVTTLDPEIVASLQSYAQTLGLRARKSKGENRTPTYAISNEKGGGNPLLQECRRLGIADKRAGDKVIPFQYKTASPGERLELLAGLVDTDGHLTNGTYEYVSKSVTLAKDVAFVARSLGMGAALRPKTVSEKTYWKVSIKGDVSRIPCRLPRKKAPARRQKKDPLRTGFSIQHAGEDGYYGFTLDGDGRYLLEDFTITHNTVIAAEIMARARQRGLRAALVVHREELIYQSIDKLTRQLGEPPGLIWKDSRQWDNPSLVMAQNTVAAGGVPESYRNIDILIFDEAHHTVAPTWLETINIIRPRYLLGLSATPFRQDKEPLCPEPFEEAIRPVTPRELIDQGVLCPAHIISPIIFSRDGDVQRISQASNLPNIYLEACRHAIANGRTKILLYVSQTPEHTPIQVMDQTVQTLKKAGISATQVHQDLTSRQRRNSIANFTETPGASVLLNYIALTEGTDLPLVDCVIVGRSTQSESTLIQMIGRGLRLHVQKKDCLVLDYSGRPDMDSIIHYWRLDEPREMGAHQPKNPPQRTKAELEELTIRFPGRISPMGANQVEYPWFRPFENRQLLALPLWNDAGQAGRYVTAEPTKDGTWRVTVITLETTGPAPVTRQQSGGLTEAEAVTQIRSLLGEKAPYIQRNASWRMKPPTDALKRTWQAMKPPEGQLQLPLAGDMSDALARERFRRRVHQLAL